MGGCIRGAGTWEGALEGRVRTRVHQRGGCVGGCIRGAGTYEGALEGRVRGRVH